MQIKKYFASNFIARLCFFVSTFLVNILFARTMGAAGSGELFYAVNNLSFFVLLGSLSLESGMTYLLAKKEMAASELATFGICWTIGASALIAIVLLWMGDHQVVSPSYGFGGSVWLFIAGNLATTFFSALFFARRQFVLPNVIPALTNFAIILIALLVPAISAVSLVLIYFSGFLANGLILGILFFRKYSIPFAFNWPENNKMAMLFRYSLLAFATNLLAFLVFRVDYWILDGFSPSIISQESLGNYIQVAKLVQLFLFIPTVIATVIFPVSAAGSEPHIFRDLKKICWQILGFNFLMCALLVITGTWLFPFMYGDSFTGMYLCFIYFIPGILSISLVRVLASFFAGINKIKYNLVGAIISLLLITALNFLLIPGMGINGAAVADSVGYLVYLVFLFLMTRSKAA